MFRQLKKTLVATAIASLTLGSIGPAFADSADTLPDMGTSAGSTLSIGQEMQMGDYYVRQLRGSAPLINCYEGNHLILPGRDGIKREPAGLLECLVLAFDTNSREDGWFWIKFDTGALLVLSHF